MLDTQISMRSIIRLIYETYHIVEPGGDIDWRLFTIEGVEGLVKANVIPRNVATIIYKLMTEYEEDE